jgi:replicative DNA helicase
MSESYRTDLERNVLGIIIWDHKLFTRVSAEVTVESFSDARHAKIFTVCAALAEAGKELDLTSVILELRRRNELEAAGGADFVSAIAADPASSDPRRLSEYVKALREQISRVKLDAVLAAMRVQAADRTIDLTTTLSDLSGKLSEIEYEEEGEELADIGAAVDEILEELRSGIELGTPTCIPSLDYAIAGGIKPTQFVVLAGPTGGGKSALASLIALRAGEWAAKHGKGGVLMFSYEMSRKELTQRMLLQATPEIRDGYHAPHGFSERDRPVVRASLEKIRALNIRIEDKGAEDISAIRGAVERYIQRTGMKPCLVIVDHMGLVGAKGSGGRELSDTEAMSRVTRGLKNMARLLSIPVIGLCQFSRAIDADTREDHRPRLSDLKQSSSIEHDANIVLLLHAPYLYYKDKEERKRLVAAGAPVTLMVAKNRSGPTVDIELEWIGPRVTFREKNVDPLLAAAPDGTLNNAAGFTEPSHSAVPEEPEAFRSEIDEAVRQLAREAENQEASVEHDDLFS